QVGKSARIRHRQGTARAVASTAGGGGIFSPPRAGRAREFKPRQRATFRSPRQYTRCPDDLEAEMDERTTLTDEELTDGAFSTRAEVADADQDDPDMDADD